VGERAPLGQRRPGVLGRPVRSQDQPGPGQGLEGVGERDHLPGGAGPAPGHGRDQAVVDPVDQEPAQLRPDPGVPAQQVAQPGHQQSPGLGRIQPRRPADRPAEQEVPLVALLGGRVEVDRGQPAHAGADPVDPGPAGQQGRQLGLPGGDPLHGRLGQRQPLTAPGHRLDRLPAQVAVPGQSDHWLCVVVAVWLG
jgi:hypothetical protein